MSDLLSNLGIFGIIVGGLVAIISFLSKAIAKTLLDKDLEEFKADLQKTAFEHRTKYAKLHDDRAIIIKELYSKLENMTISCQNVMSPLERILKTSEENDHTTEVQEADVILDEVVVARGNAAELSQPGK